MTERYEDILPFPEAVEDARTRVGEALVALSNALRESVHDIMGEAGELIAEAQAAGHTADDESPETAMTKVEVGAAMRRMGELSLYGIRVERMGAVLGSKGAGHERAPMAEVLGVLQGLAVSEALICERDYQACPEVVQRAITELEGSGRLQALAGAIIGDGDGPGVDAVERAVLDRAAELGGTLRAADPDDDEGEAPPTMGLGGVGGYL